MFDLLIRYSIRHKAVVGLGVLALVLWGGYSLRQLPIDAVPDITNNQIQVITASPTLATQEVEQFITTPVELALQNLQELVEIRSISRFGLSVVTVVFTESTDPYLARQWVSERLTEAAEAIPAELGRPEMAPLTTGLGEIYQYALAVAPGYEDRYSPTELRSIQDWIVSRQLAGIEGVVEINTMGGYLKQYEVAVDPDRLKSYGITLAEIFTALNQSNENTGGAYIEKDRSTYYIRTDGLLSSQADIRAVVVDVRGGRPIRISDVATVQFGRAPRYGALVRNGEEAVGGRVMMLKGANSAAVTERVRERVEQIQRSLPEGVRIEPYLVRDKLIRTAIGTVRTNLIEGGLIVVFLLVLLLGNWRASLIVASVIPLAMLFAVSMMNLLGISANLMSLGAIDFGLIVDGAVIIVEAIVHRLQVNFAGQTLSRAEMDAAVETSALRIRGSAAFGEIIILMVYLPILALVGIEGTMFRPMAQTVMLAITGALILSLTYVPMMSALFLSRRVSDRVTIADRIMGFAQRVYAPVLRFALRWKGAVVAATVLLFALSGWVFLRMGGEFIPTLEEGDLAMQQILPPGTSLSQSVEMTERVQQHILQEFPEVREVVTAIGSAEIPTDPMPVEIGDYTLVMAPRDEWTTADNRPEMFEKLEEAVALFPGLGLEFSQPIQLRFNELMTGTKADIAIKLYGQDLDVAYARARAAERLIRPLPGVASVTVEQTVGMPQLIVSFNYPKLAQYGLQTGDVNAVIRAAYAGATAGTVYEGERRFDLTVRLDERYRTDPAAVERLYVPLPGGGQVPLREVARVDLRDAPMQISRENTNRRIVIGVNVGATDVETLVGRIRQTLEADLSLPAGYYLTYGGQFEQLRAAKARLAVAVPLALGLIFVLLYFTFGSFVQAALIFVAIPLSAIGGVWALQLRGMPFSISAGIGFIALFGVAVLNGIVLIGYFNQLRREGIDDVRERILRGTRVRLRPVLLTAAVASLGFLPMALSTSGGAEVQRPLATVVIGGLVSATFLTLVVLPILYSWVERRGKLPLNKGLLLLFCCCLPGWARTQVQSLDLEAVTAAALAASPELRAAELTNQRNRALEDLPWQPGRTDLSYRGDALFRPNEQQVNQLSLLQRFDHPAVVRARNDRQQALTTLGEDEGRLTAAELRLRVSELYYLAQQRRALARHYADLADRLYDIYRIANERATVGAESDLPALRLYAEWKSTEQLATQAETEAELLGVQLATWARLDGYVEPADSLRRADLPVDDPALDAPLTLRREVSAIEVAKREGAVIRAEGKPEFRLGYSAQQYIEGGYLSGIEAGVALPLWQGALRQRSAVARVELDRAYARLGVAEQTYYRELAAARRELVTAETYLDFYLASLEDLRRRTTDRARLQYTAGSIGYLELLAVLREAAEDRATYLRQLLAYNLAVARLHYLETR